MMTSAFPAKRMKVVAAGSAVHALVTSEPALLDAIVSYVPVEQRKPTPPTSTEYERSTTFNHGDVPVDTTLATIASLWRAFPSLGKRLGPQHESFWRAMVLRRFDFQVDPKERFNDDADADEWAHEVSVNASAIKAATIQWRIDHPTTNHRNGTILANALAYWPAIGAYFRPAEFAFLGEILRGTADMSSWPAHEDAFSLYRDLVLIEGRLSKFQDLLETFSEANYYVTPCLLSRVKGESPSVTNGGFELLRHCDFMPHRWGGHQHDRWTGLDMPLPQDKPVEPATSHHGDIDEDLNQNEWQLRTAEEKAIFPLTEENWRSFERLRRVVHESFVDWRRVHVNWSEYSSVEFYIGESKVSRRWLGFVGESTYCNHRPPPRTNASSPKELKRKTIGRKGLGNAGTF